ncbi:nose resistant to fluoxetine protein 6 [Nephila pilipes]|uniref:Nose resistant to fluoxetine protein 6 n=1 Tax=Nephila pilipes TaxID=299642 RepID=A0A8X6UBG4_NEPPI|nr:nose resistant to fluoxetine protein 6 [Nephila pilipes]
MRIFSFRYVILAFLGLSVIGTLITFYNYLCNGRKETNSPNSVQNKNYDIRKGSNKEDAKKSSDTTSDSGSSKASESFFNCFCIVTNLRKILQTSTNEDPLSCLFGMRSLSTMWVIFCHCIAFYCGALKGVDNIEIFNKWYGQFLLNAHSVITAFFLLGGFLNAFLFLSYYEKTNGKIPYVLYYLNRVIRISPLYMLVYGFSTYLYSYTGSGPLWPRYTINTLCRDTWWQNLFYITNLWSVYNQCLPWGWYVMVDMQLYIISPLFLVPLIKWPKLGYSLIITAILGGSLASYILTLQYNLGSGISSFGPKNQGFYSTVSQFWEYFDKLYAQPYTRISPYLIGFLLAHYVYKRRMNKTAKESKLTLLCGWIISTVLMGIFVFALYGRDVTTWDIAVYNGVKEIFFSCGFGWIVYVCVTGQAGILNTFLSWKYFAPLSRICFSAYLINFIIIIRYYFQADKLETPILLPLVYQMAHVFSLTFLFSFLISLIFEFPVARLFTSCVKSKTKMEKKD